MSTPTDTGQPDRHYQPLLNAIPPWLGRAPAHRRQALSQAKPVPLTATAAQHTELKRLNGEHWAAQNAVDAALKNLQEPKAFARALLEDALLTRYGLDLNSQTVYLRLYIPLTVPWFPIRTGAARTWTVSLVDAALHNFEHSETVEGAFEPESTFISQPDASGQFETLPAIRQKLTVYTFTSLCRELDIGARYQTYLREQLGLTEPVSAAVVQHKVSSSQQAALRAALQLARIQADIQEDYARIIEGLLDGRSPLTLNNLPIHCHTLHMMEAPLTGILLIAPNLETTRTVQRVVAYVPDDPQHPLKEYPSALAFQQELTRQLRDDAYQGFFSRFVAHKQRGLFFANLGQRLARITFHPPEHGSGLAPWRKEPTDDPKLQFVATPMAGELWQNLYQQKLDKILNDALTQAVSTADVDRAARWALWDSFVNVATSVLNAALLIVAPFVPGLGELMLGYMAYQLLDDVFEGVVDWAEGLSGEAFAHLMSVLESLVQAGTFVAGVSIGTAQLRKVLPQEVLGFLDRFKPVTLANRASRYWQPDLAPYRQRLSLPARLGVDRLGLHQVRGEAILPLDDALYAVQNQGDHSVIKHPSRVDAYTPRLHHNGAGAWHTELESPLQWDRATLLRRLGHGVSDLSDGDRQLALGVSGVDENALRKMHLRGEPVPALLDDSLERVRIDRSLHSLIQHLNSDDPATLRQIDPQDELQLLTAYGDWPASRSLRMLDAQGRVTWAFGDLAQPVVQVHEAQLQNGELLGTVLQALTPQEATAAFGAPVGDTTLSLPERAAHLRKRLALLVDRNRAQLFESRYAQRQMAQGAHGQQLLKSAPGLPAGLTARLLEHAHGEELEALDQQRTPERLATMARHALTELRVNRAYEGQHLDAVRNLDSDRLALNTLRTLPGWSDQVQLDARHLTADGATWLRIGADDAPQRRTLVRTAQGRYIPHDAQGPLAAETDLYSAMLQVLPPAQREALGFNVDEGAKLRERLRQRPLPREQLRQALGFETLTEPARETLRHLGSDNGYALLPAEPAPTPYQRARHLYPALGDGQINGLLEHLNSQTGGVHNGLAALAEEYRQLEADLRTWAEDDPAPAAADERGTSMLRRRRERRNRSLIAAQLRRCWRRETGVDSYYDDPDRDGHILRLEYPVQGPMPTLTANFEHVSLLSLTGHAATTGADAFLGNFRQLRHLEVKNVNFVGLPTALEHMARLNTLALSNCHIALTAASRARLEAMSRLQVLALNHNPLGLTPSVESMPALVHLDLSHTGIDQWPAGLLTRPQLDAALLSDNRIRELPAPLFELPPHLSEKYDLGANPLSPSALDQVKRYYQRHGTQFEIDAPAADKRDAQALYPSLDHDQLTRLIFSLPGDIEAGRIELARRSAELHTLQQQLSQWEQTPGLERRELARRIALRQVLERCWRREPNGESPNIHSLTLGQELIGELPLMSAQFRHVGSLLIQGNERAMDVSHFLGNFPGLNILELHNIALGDIPAAVFDLRNLGFVSLQRCSIRLSAASRAGIESHTSLKFLNLSHNPLGQLPDFSRLPDLSAIFLQDTGLDAIPASLLHGATRGTLDLSHNAIAHLPDALFALPLEATQAFDLSANPLSPQALAQVKSYCQRTLEHFNVDAPASQRARVKRLYPTLRDREANRFIFQLPGTLGGVNAELLRLEVEYEQLGNDLQQWSIHVPERHPILDIPLDDVTRAEEQLNRSRFKAVLEHAWRREGPIDEETLDDSDSQTLDIDIAVMGALPELSARFDHVSSFKYKGAGLTTQVDGTLRCFTQLQTLILRRCLLPTVPASIYHMPSLAYLELPGCGLRLTPATARSLGDLHQLDFLELNDNPLGIAPDVSGLTQLSSLHLRHCELTQVPPGLFGLNHLQTLDLSGNQIEHMPAALLEFSQAFLDDSDLSGNPWSAQSLAYLREYFRQTGTDFQLLEATVDTNGNAITPPLEEEPMEE